MIHNRISALMQPSKKRPSSPASQLKTVLTPPPNFVPVPLSMLANVSQGQLSWQEQLYRMAYAAAQASVAAAARASDRYRWN
jgi:hypothetical protein